MGKAYTDKEREDIRVRLLEEALNLYHDDNVKALNIRDLTGRVGISLGCFYSFYKDKDAMILDIVRYRGMQKIEIAFNDFSASLTDPAGYLCDIIYNFISDMKNKAGSKKMYEDVLTISARKTSEYVDAFYSLLENTLKRLVGYWQDNGYKVTADWKGISSVITAGGCLLTGSVQITQPYFDDMLRSFIDVNIARYLTVSKRAKRTKE